jgi:hypothetical protein
VPYLEAGEDRIDLGRALRRLGEVPGVDCVVSDAGGVLNGALLRVRDLQLISAESRPDGSVFVRYATR